MVCLKPGGSVFIRISSVCNAIIERADADAAHWNSEADKNAIVGEAKFLRAFAYRFLANMWGTAPLVLEETKNPRFDYTNSTQEQLYKQCKEDLEFAIQYMPDIDDQKGWPCFKSGSFAFAL